MKNFTEKTKNILNNKLLLHEIFEKATVNQTGVTLKELFEFGTDITTNSLIHAGNFLRHELPIRFAHRIRDLDDLPHGLSKMPSVIKVKNWYIQSYMEISKFPRIRTTSQEVKFTNLIRRIKIRHNGTLYTMARGVNELKNHLSSFNGKQIKPKDWVNLSEIHSFLDSFYMSRIGIRMIMSQHIALHESEPGWVGCICETSSPAEIALAAIDTARLMCIRQYGDAPNVALHGHTDLTIPYVPSHLHHMVFEVMKNAMRAVVEFHGVDNNMPTIRIIISDGIDNEDVSIKISDEGGGIPRSAMNRIWSYTYTTASYQDLNIVEPPSDFGGDAPLAGLGYGLPISRLFSRYFGGDLQLISMEGYGTDAYLHLKRVGDASEPLP